MGDVNPDVAESVGDATADAPVDAPTDGPAAAPAEASDDAPADATADAPTDGPAAAPAELSDDAPADATADAPAGAPTDGPAVAPAGAPEDAEPKHDTIFVGGKPIMTYVNATLTQIKSAPVVTLKARGHRIKQAVDVALTIAKRLNAVGYSIGDVRISSNLMESLDGKNRNISTIEIDIQKSDS